MEKSEMIREVIKKYDCAIEGSSLSDSKYLPKLFDIMTSEDDLKVMVNLPGDSKKVADKLKISEKEAAKLLRSLYMRGLVFIKEGTAREPEFCFGDIGLLMDSVLFDKRYEKHGPSFYKMWKKYLNEEHIHMYQAESGFRVLPVEEQISKGEVLESSKIIPSERASEILKKAKLIAVAKCPCRIREKNCSKPLETCIALDKLAEWEISRGMARKITLEEALDILKLSEEHGLIHETVNSETPDVICNCCSCCCSFLKSILEHDIKAASIKSRYISTFDLKKCEKCADMVCVEKCIFGGIRIEDGRLKINSERCWGCGLCANVCPEDAIEMKLIRKEDHIPKVEAKFFSYDKMD